MIHMYLTQKGTTLEILNILAPFMFFDMVPIFSSLQIKEEEKQKKLWLASKFCIVEIKTRVNKWTQAAADMIKASYGSFVECPVIMSLIWLKRTIEFKCCTM